MKHRAVGLLLAVVMTLGMSACSPAAPAGTDGSVLVEKHLEPLTSEDDALLWMNPDRGYRIDSWCDLYEMSRRRP